MQATFPIDPEVDYCQYFFITSKATGKLNCTSFFINMH